MDSTSRHNTSHSSDNRLACLTKAAALHARRSPDCQDELMLQLRLNVAKGNDRDWLVDVHIFLGLAQVLEANKEEHLVPEACCQLMLAVNHLSIDDRKLAEPLIERMMEISARSDAADKAYSGGKSAAQNDKDMRRIVLAMIDELGSACRFWKSFFETCKQDFAKIKTLECVATKVDFDLKFIAGRFTEALVIETMQGDKALLSDEEPYMLLAHAYHLRTFVQLRKHSQETYIHRAYECSQLVHSVAMLNATGNRAILQAIKDAYDRLVMINTDDIEMGELAISGGGDEVEDTGAADVDMAELDLEDGDEDEYLEFEGEEGGGAWEAVLADVGIKRKV